MSRKLTMLEFMSKLSDRQKSKYDFTLFEYKGRAIKSTVICDLHGQFSISPNALFAGQGCKICGYITVANKLSGVKRIHTDDITKKVCSKCKEEKLVEEFRSHPKGHLGRHSVCKKCAIKIAKIKSKKFKIFQYHKFCNTCSKCLPISEFREIKNKELFHACRKCEVVISKKIRESKKDWFKEYREANKEKANKYSTAMYYKNINKNRKMSADNSRKIPTFEQYGDKLLVVDTPTKDDNGMLMVGCKHCRKLFYPTKSQCRNRINSIAGKSRGEGNFYCCEECKQNCDVYKVRFIRKSERRVAQKARACQNSSRKAMLSSQCGEHGDNRCERCGDIIDVELHHTNEISKGGDINNPAGFILLCTRCHDIIHSSCK